MVDFSNIAAFEPKNEPRLYVDRDLTLSPKLGPVKLFSLPALDTNKPYHNEWLRRVAARQEEGGRGTEVTGDVLSEARSEDRELLGTLCLTGWENVVDAKGNPVEFTPAEGWEFLKALPNWLFDRYRNWAMTPLRFVSVDPAQIEKLGN